MKIFMKNLLIALISICSTASYFAQTVVYSEDFNGATAWTLNTDPTAEDSNPNTWYISCQEEGVGSGNCGSACGAGDFTLHVSTNVTDLGAAYVELGMGVTGTNRRAESGDINTTGFTNLTLNFDMIGNGGNAQDYCELFYSTDSGTSWTSLAPTLTSMCCDGAGNPVACSGSEQGLWQTESYALPASCENITTLRISFVWRNVDDGIATDPSFAADNIEIVSAVVAAPPVAAFTPSQTSICENDCINFTDNSTNTPTTWAWDFGNTQTSAVQNPTNICYATAGVYTVSLTVTNANGSNTTTQNITVSACSSPPVSAFTPSQSNLCTNDCISFADNSTGNPTTWAWDFGNSQTSTAQNPTGICYNTNGSYTVSLTVTNSVGSNTSTQTITVANCSPPIADFSIVSDSICEGDCIIITDLSTNEPTTWDWTFGGGTPATSSDQDPGPICFDAAGDYTIDLTVTNAFGTNSISMPIHVGTIPVIIATGDTTIDMGGEAVLSSIGLGGVYNWIPSSEVDCDTCPTVIATPLLDTDFYVQMISPEGCIAQDTVRVIVNFEDIIDVPNSFSPNGDGTNDLLYVKGVGITDMNFKIYNRYGQLIFETTDQTEGWDGTFKGQAENPGVFLYILDYTLIDDTSLVKKGNVTLVK